MTYQTDERIKSYLDTNQLAREQMCLAVLSIDKRYSDVRPRHPRGGPDHGRDIEAIFKAEYKVFGAIGFINQANDSSPQKQKIKKKFKEDLDSALSQDTKPTVFVFFTNLNLGIKEKDQLELAARKSGISYCEIFDRERIRIILDSPDGFSIRFQYLNIPLSAPEQQTFFARWGEDIQSVISTGFQSIKGTIDRVLFLQECLNPLQRFTIVLELDRTYSGDEIGHFRAFCSLYLKAVKQNLVSIIFGITDKSQRIGTKSGAAESHDKKGIKYGVSSGQWENLYKGPEPKAEDYEKEVEKYTLTGSSSSIGRDEVGSIVLSYDKDHLVRYPNSLMLKDFDECMFIFLVNQSLADKIQKIVVYGNEYKLQEIERFDLEIDADSMNSKIPVNFSENELQDKWVRINPKKSSFMTVNFSEYTPHRFYDPIPVHGK